jgi:hypothetical protein
MITCDFDCMNCPYDDCIQSGGSIVKAQPKKGRKERKPQVRGTSLAYCYNATFKPIEYTEGLRTSKMAREDLEAMLKHQFGRKLEPVREQLPRKRREGMVVYLNDDIRKRHR